MRYEYLCPRCERRMLVYWRPTSTPTCRHGRRWALFGARMQPI